MAKCQRCGNEIELKCKQVSAIRGAEIKESTIVTHIKCSKCGHEALIFGEGTVIAKKTVKQPKR